MWLTKTGNVIQFIMAQYFQQLYKTLIMADNPNKKKADGKRVSQQPHEQAYQKRKAKGAAKKSSTKGKG